MGLLELRKQYELSQLAVANLLNMPVRTYVRYEKDTRYGNKLKRNMMEKIIIDKCEITETKGLLSLDKIKALVSEILESKYKDTVEFCYLFGSYAKGYATEKSDVDLCVSTSLKGLDVLGLMEDIRNVLHKNVDLVRFNALEKNLTLLSEIMKDGIRIYRQSK